MPPSEKLRRAYWVWFAAAAFLWGTGYPDFFRYPVYLGVPLLAAPLLPRIPWMAALIAGVGACLSIFYYAAQGNAASAGWLFAVVAWMGLATEVTREMGRGLDDATRRECITRGIRIASLVGAATAALDAALRAGGIRLWFFNSGLFPAGVFPEPSHLGFTMGPALVFLWGAPGSRVFAAVVAGLLALVAPSGTLVAAIVIGLVISRLRRWPALVVAAVIALPFVSLLATIRADPFMAEHKYASAFVWLNGFDRAIQYSEQSWFGMGPFGWIQDAADAENSELNLSAMNIRDLASLAPFTLASFGVVGVALLLVAVWRLSGIAAAPNTAGAMAAVALILIGTHLFRWSGFLLSPLPAVIVLLLASRRSQTP